MLKIDIKPSRQLIILMWAVLIISESIFVFLPFSYVLRGIFCLAVLGYWIILFKKHALLCHSQSLVQIQRATHDSDWKIVTRTNEYFGKVLGSSTLTTRLCVLRFEKILGGISEFVIFADSVGRENFRELIFEVRSK